MSAGWFLAYRWPQPHPHIPQLIYTPHTSNLFIVRETARDVFQLCGDVCSKSSSLGRSSRNPLGHTSRTLGGNKKVRRR